MTNLLGFSETGAAQLECRGLDPTVRITQAISSNETRNFWGTLAMFQADVGCVFHPFF